MSFGGATTGLIVRSTTGVYTAIGAIGTFLSVVGGIIVAYWKFGYKFKEIASSDRRGDLDDMRRRITELETAGLAAAKELVLAKEQSARELREANENANRIQRESDERAHKFELRMQSAINVCRILLVFVEQVKPDAFELKLARELMELASTDDMGVSRGYDRVVAKMTERNS